MVNASDSRNFLGGLIMVVDYVTVFSYEVNSIVCDAILCENDYLEFYAADKLILAYPMRHLLTFRVIFNGRRNVE